MLALVNSERALIDAVLSEVAAVGNVLRSRSSSRMLPPKAASTLLLLHEHGPMTVPQLARLGRTSRQNAQVIVNGLLRKGLLERSKNPAHQRSALVQLSLSAREMVLASQTRRDSLARQLEASCPTADLESTLRTLVRLREVAQRTKSDSLSPSPEEPQPKKPRKTNAKPPPESAEELPVNLL